MKKKLLAAAVAVCAVVLAVVIGADFLFSKETNEVLLSMNTTVSLDITGYKPEQTAKEIKEEIMRLDTELLSRTSASSELYALNNGKAQVSDELATLLAELKQIEIDSDGAFCVALGALSDLWGINTDNPKVPTQAEIDAVLKNTKDWSIDGNTVYIPKGVKLDMGAVGKGYACDSMMGIIYGLNHIKTVAAVGGSVLVYSSEPKETFRLGIRDPLGQATDYCAILETTGSCVSTSGNYERFFEDEKGNRYHHIFDPSTGYPADSDINSVTVITQYGYISDALSTACFVLGVEKSLPLLEKYNAEAIFITNNNEIISTLSDGDSATLTVTNNNYKLGELR
ncbi:MAG: FAD:protein FMN transferase [Clostridia bacterium]|nr:FAD:protein FMN transferase [Clostridia bacterium]